MGRFFREGGISQFYYSHLDKNGNLDLESIGRVTSSSNSSSSSSGSYKSYSSCSRNKYDISRPSAEDIRKENEFYENHEW